METSTNLASVKPAGSSGGRAAYSIINTTRSSIPAALTAERSRIAALARMAGAEVHQPGTYPGWAPNTRSPLLALTQEVLRKVRPMGRSERRC